MTYTAPVVAPKPRQPGPLATSPGATADPFGGMNDAERSAAGVLSQILGQFGLNSLIPTALNYVRKGYDENTVQYLLTQTQQYKQRFAANDQRVKNGLPPLSPADYIATEESYKQLFQSYGVPKNLFDQPSDLQQYIANDVSPSEVKSRLDQATSHVQQLDPGLRSAFSAYGIDSGHLLSYALDQNRALPVLQQQFAAADIGAAAARQGLQVTGQGDALHYAAMGVTADQATNAYQKIGQALPVDSAAAQRYGFDPYTQATAEGEFLGNNANAARQRQQIEGQEKATFAGQGGVGSNLYHLGYGLATDESTF